MSDNLLEKSAGLDMRLSNKIANMGFLCTCLVVVIHSPEPTTREMTVIEHLVKGMLTTVAVPVFFIISGYLLAMRMPRPLTVCGCGAEWWRRAIKKRIRTIGIPYVLIGLLWFPVKYFVHWLGVRYFGADGSAEVMRMTVYNFAAGTGLLPWGHSVVVGFWYLKTLFLLVIISPVLGIMVSRSRILAVMFLVLLLVAWSVQMNLVAVYGDDSVWNYELNMRCPFFFTLGMALNIHAPGCMPKRAWLVLIPLAVAMCWLNEICVSADVLVKVPIACTCTLALAAAIWSIVPCSKWPSYISGNSFPLFALHGAILYLLPIPFKAMHCWTSIVDCMGPLPIAFVVVVIGLVMVTLLKTKYPRFSGVIFGGR